MKYLLLLIAIIISPIYIYAQGWGQIQKIVPIDRALGDFFGQSVAMDGDYAVVGSYQDDLTSNNMGSAYVYKKDASGNWIEHQKLTASDKRQFDQFGEYVDIDGNFMIVGARGQDYDENDFNFENSAGAAYIFENDGNGNWNEIQKIVSSDRGATFQSVFGQTLAISGNYAVVNSARENTGLDGQQDLSTAGACYIFERDSNGIWIEVQKIVSSDRDANERWGEFATDISGNTIVVGAVNENLDDIGNNELTNAGAIYVFERDTNGIWNEIQKIVNSDRESGDTFGRSVSIDGNQLIVGADYEDINGNASGAAYIFEKNGIGVWNEVQKITSVSGMDNSRFGQRVAIDVNRTIIGSWVRDIGNIGDGGAAYIFEKDGTGFWNETAILYDPDASSSDYFGFSVAISGDHCFVSANQEDEDETNQNSLQEAGSVFVFDINEPNTLPPLSTLSVADNEIELSIKAYPNPVQNVLNIDLGNYTDKVSINVYNYLGQKFISKTYTNLNRIQLPFNLSKGLYLVEVKIDYQIASVLKIVKH